MEVEIKDFDKLLAPALGGKTVVSYKSKKLLSPGENYGSVMLAVDVKLQDCDEELHLVAKLCPPTDFMKNMFNIQLTYRKEVAFYTTIIPTLQEFQREQGCEDVIDFVPKYYGSRISLDPEATAVDDDACLLLENLKVQGFDTGDRLNGFDLETATFLVKNLATLHAVPIALKLKHPRRFQEKILPHLSNYYTGNIFSEEMESGFIKTMLDSAKKHVECSKYLDRLEKGLMESSKYFRTLDGEREGVFATVTHSDFWVNNTLLKYDNGKIVKNAMVDFQIINYGNPAHDLIFFIYSSVNNDIITKHYEDLVNLYYEKFIEVLTTLHINHAEFTYENFQKEIKNAATKMQLYHFAFMLKPIFTEKNKVKELSDMNENEFLETETLSDRYYSKLWLIVLDFVKRGWL